MKQIVKVIILSMLFQFSLFSIQASAVNYSVTYNANETQHQLGVTSGSVPSTTSYASGTVVTVAANSGNLARQGFTFAGWNTLANGLGTNYTAGSGIFTLNASITLYAKWTIPASARLIGAGGSLVPITNPNSVANGTSCTGGNIRGITSDGSHVYFRPSNATTYICKVDMNGYVVQAINIGASLSAIPIGSIALNYCLMQANIDGVLIGVDSLQQLKENIAFAENKVPNQYLDEINNIRINNVELLNPSMWKLKQY